VERAKRIGGSELLKEKGYFYILAVPLGEEDLARAEFEALVGTAANDGRLPTAPQGVDVSRAAYVSVCAEHIASAAELEELCCQVRQENLKAAGFAIREKRIPHKLKAHLREGVIRVADCIGGYPALGNPSVEFILVATPAGWHFGRQVSESKRSWTRHARKLHSCSSSISSRMARAMVNLGGLPGQRLLDPCCGAGTILIEAADMGLKAVGCDINPLWPPRAAENARKHGLAVETFAGDAREIDGHFDVVVTNLPYGRNTPWEADLAPQILAHMRRLAPRLVVVSGQPLERILRDVGYQERLRATASKGSLVRYFYSCVALQNGP